MSIELAEPRGQAPMESVAFCSGEGRAYLRNIEKLTGCRLRPIPMVAPMHRTKPRGLAKVDWSFTFAASAYNLVRMPRLLTAAT